ncbi:hypothetical protein DSECCO2_53600 [anaerobic digester metagenome]
MVNSKSDICKVNGYQLFPTGHDLAKYILMMHHKKNKGKEVFNNIPLSVNMDPVGSELD